jgi:hypothetical protein
MAKYFIETSSAGICIAWQEGTRCEIILFTIDTCTVLYTYRGTCKQVIDSIVTAQPSCQEQSIDGQGERGWGSV